MENCEFETALAASAAVRVILKVIHDRYTRMTRNGIASTRLKLDVCAAVLFVVFFTILKIG